MGFGICGEAGRQATLCGNASQEDTHGIRKRQADASKCVGGFILELIIHADM